MELKQNFVILGKFFFCPSNDREYFIRAFSFFKFHEKYHWRNENYEIANIHTITWTIHLAKSYQ